MRPPFKRLEKRSNARLPRLVCCVLLGNGAPACTRNMQHGQWEKLADLASLRALMEGQSAGEFVVWWLARSRAVAML